MKKLCASLFGCTFGRRHRSLHAIPGPTPTFPLGTALDFAHRSKAQPWEVCAEYGREYGGLTLIWIAGMPALVLNDPDLIGEVLVHRQEDFYKDKPCRALLPIVGRSSPFIGNGAEWETLRRNEPLCADGIADWLKLQFHPVQTAIVQRIRDSAKTSHPLDLMGMIQRATFDAFTAVACGEQPGDAGYADFMRLAKTGTSRMESPVVVTDTPLSPGFRSARSRWLGRFQKYVREAADKPDPDRHDLLAFRLRGGADPDDDLRDGIANLMYGGVFSAASGVVVALYLLARHPAVAERLRGELADVASDSQEIDSVALSRCEFLDCVLREALRYHSPVPLFFRNVVRDRSVELGGHQIPANTILLITNSYLHRSPAHWQRPDEFDPSRWENGGIEATPIGSDYFMPFGRGPRMCPGVPFAMMYMKLALATLLSKFTVDIGASQPFQQNFFFGVMQPRNLKARVELKA